MKRRILLHAAGAAVLLQTAAPLAGNPPPRVLIVGTSHAAAPGGRTTGAWLPELTDPYWIFRDAGCVVDFGTIRGEAPPIDPRSGSERALPARLRDDDSALKAFHEAVCVDCVDGRRYAAVFLAGGRGALWDFPASESLRALLERAAHDRRPIGAVSHGPAGLIGARIDGRPLAAGRRLTCASDEEEVRAHWSTHLPFSLEQRLKAEGALLQTAGADRSHVVRDGALISGQNAVSAGAAARLVLDALRGG